MRGTSSKTKTHRHRATDVPASTFYLVKLVEDDDYVAPVIIKWLRQDLGILSFLSTASKDWWDDWYNYKHKFLVHPCIRQGTLFSVTLSREKPCLVGSSLCTAAPLPSKQKISLSRRFLGEVASVHRLVGPEKKKKGGYINWLSFLLEQPLLLR